MKFKCLDCGESNDEVLSFDDDSCPVCGSEDYYYEESLVDEHDGHFEGSFHSSYGSDDLEE